MDDTQQGLNQAQYSVSAIPYHTHNGTDSPRIAGSPTGIIAGRSWGGTNTILSVSDAGSKVNLATNDYAVGITWDATGFGFVCVTAGYYQVDAMIRYTNATVGEVILCNIYVNSTMTTSNYFHASNTATSVAASDVVKLAVGDEVYLYGGDEGHNVNFSNQTAYTFLSIAAL